MAILPQASTGAVQVFPVPVKEHLLTAPSADTYFLNKPKQYFAFNICVP